MFQRIAAEARRLPGSSHAVLELGSGPGFLAEAILESVPVHTYTLVDSSAAMHRLARERLAGFSGCAFVTVDFSTADWSFGLGPFDAVVTMQAVHELRHKRRASRLHASLRRLLRAGGLYLVCDHVAGPGGMQDTELYATIDEQALALSAAEFERVRLLDRVGSLALHLAVRTARDT